MSHTQSGRILLGAASGLLLCSAASAAPLGVEDYNVFTFGDFANTSDVEGSLAVGGNATLSGFGVGVHATGAVPTLVTGGDLNFSNGSVTNGDTFVGGNLTSQSVGYGTGSPTGDLNVIGNYTFNAGNTVQGDFNTPQNTAPTNVSVNGNTNLNTAVSLPVNFAALEADLRNTSAFLAGLTADGTDTGPAINLNGSNSDLNVFFISGAELSGANSVTINVPTASTTILNIDGANVSANNMSFNLNGLPSSNLLLNFFEATTLTIASVHVTGSILAPDAELDFNNGLITGTVVADSVALGSGQFNFGPFNGNIPDADVPAPATLMALAGGLLLLRRRQQRALKLVA